MDLLEHSYPCGLFARSSLRSRLIKKGIMGIQNEHIGIILYDVPPKGVYKIQKHGMIMTKVHPSICYKLEFSIDRFEGKYEA